MSDLKSVLVFSQKNSVCNHIGDELGAQVYFRIFFSLSSLFKYSCNITGAFV